MRTFALPRISNVTGTGHHFARDPAFTPAQYFGGSLGVLRGEGSLVVRIAFDAYAAALVRERFWHHSQVITEKAGGELELELRLSHPDEAMRWALSWGGHARVLSPSDLVETMRQTIRQMSATY